MDIRLLETAAESVLAPPNAVNENERKAAEAVFQNLKQENYPLNSYVQATNSTNHQFVLYEISQALAETILRRWVVLNAEEIQATYKAVLEFIVTTESLSTYVISDFLRTVAITIKRGMLDNKTGDPEELCQLIRQMITDENPRLQSIGCQLIYAITEQFSTAWRNAHLSITWDFHIRAKSEFEKKTLRVLFEMSLETLAVLCNQQNILGNDFYRRLCDKFLEVAETIFQWNFSARIFRRFFACTTMSNSFRPPVSWNDLVTNDNFLSLFFRLHSLIRGDVELSLKSIGCLSQLASFSGEIMNSNSDFARTYVKRYVQSLIELFQTDVFPHEVNGLCQIINRLFVFRPVNQIVQMPDDIRNQFFSFLYQYMNYLLKEAMVKALGANDHSDHVSVVMLLDAWVIMLRGRWRVGLETDIQEEIENNLLLQPTQDLVNTLILSVQAPPFGCRPLISHDEEQDDDDDEQDDREMFKDILTSFSTMATYTISTFTSSAAHLIHTKLDDFKKLMNSNDNLKSLQDWQEDMHWIMLFLANSIVNEDLDGSCAMAAEVYESSGQLTESRGSDFNEDVKLQYLLHCIQNPAGDRVLNSQEIDPYIILLGEIFAWNALESQMMISDNTRRLVSPELARSSTLCLKRYINASSHIPDDCTDTKLPLLYPNDGFSDVLVRFVLEKVFTVLQYFSGETRLCIDAVDLLTSLIDSRADYLARGNQLYEMLCKIDLAKLPSRSKLMTALVLIAAQADDPAIQENMYQQILVPLIDRFKELSVQPSTSQLDSDLADLLQCFTGVALAGSTNTACALTEFLNPLLQHCVPLMYTRAHCQPIITAILQLMLDITTKVCIYVEDQAKGEDLYNALIKIVEGYAAHQKQRLSSMATVDEEEKATDLVLFMEILSNVLSKDILEGGPNKVATGAQVVMMSLEMLLTIMNENILKIPEVANKFYRLIVYLVEFSAEALQQMSNDLLNSVFHCVRIGMQSTFGPEICSLALEALTEIGMFMSINRRENEIVAGHLRELIPLAFECCLDYSCENSLFTESTSALYALICFDKAVFESFILNLLSHKSNQEAAEHLNIAFAELLPEELKPSRGARLDFRRRMERLLNQIQGLLTIP